MDGSAHFSQVCVGGGAEVLGPQLGVGIEVDRLSGGYWEA